MKKNYKSQILTSLFRHQLVQFNDQKKVITHYIMSGEANAYGQVLNPDGYDDTTYRKSPVVLFQHGLNDYFVTTPAKEQLDFLIGKNISLEVETNGMKKYIKADTEFREDSTMAMDLYNLYKDEFIHAWSKWFYPISEPKFEGDYVYYDSWGMREYSAVFIPVDADATTAEANTLHALTSVKNDKLKHYMYRHFLNNSIDKDAQLQQLVGDIANLKNELTAGKSNISDEEMKLYIKDSFTQYNKIISEKFKELNNSFNSLIDFTKDYNSYVEAKVEQKFNELVAKTIGKVN